MLKLALLLLLCVLGYQLVSALRKTSSKPRPESEVGAVDPAQAVEAEFETQEVETPAADDTST